MQPDKKPSSSEKNNVSISGDVNGVVIVGNENTVNQTIIQKFFNIFKSDSETLEHRNRRILLGHVENAWIKGVLDASLHGAALLDLGIKQDPEAVTKYPWAIKKESTDETLPAGTSMLEIFDSIGMGRSLLILGAPGSGKTTMLLELARGLIERAKEDITQPLPMVFNLASWTEKLTLADWLAQELNNLYSVPRKTAPYWVKGNKLLLLLDGLDEVRQESRAKCVEAINAFRKEHGLTSLAVCSRSQDYADINAKLSFEGAIEVQTLTQKQITEFFNRFGKEMAGIKQVLKKDSALREMAETPLFLSIMIMAYQDKRDVDILTSENESAQRKHLFDTYIERMFERPGRSKSEAFKKTGCVLLAIMVGAKDD
jgi:energy-coupling factor transporter ATP-binding protein EcfA2